jgi:hypothetical protein
MIQQVERGQRRWGDRALGRNGQAPLGTRSQTVARGSDASRSGVASSSVSSGGGTYASSGKPSRPAQP